MPASVDPGASCPGFLLVVLSLCPIFFGLTPAELDRTALDRTAWRRCCCVMRERAVNEAADRPPLLLCHLSCEMGVRPRSSSIVSPDKSRDNRGTQSRAGSVTNTHKCWSLFFTSRTSRSGLLSCMPWAFGAGQFLVVRNLTALPSCTKTPKPHLPSLDQGSSSAESQPTEP